MLQIKRPIKSQLIEFQCECGKGVYRRDHSGPVQCKYPLSYPHKCTHCGVTVFFPAAYPLLETISNNRQRCFMLEDDDRFANNRAGVSHEHTRAQERQMGRFKSPGQVQRFLAVHSQVYNLFCVGRHLLSGAKYRILRSRSFDSWWQVTCAC